MLLGAPSIVLAVDRYATCIYEATEDQGLRLKAVPLNEDVLVSSIQDLATKSDVSVVRLISLFNEYLPKLSNAQICVDTTKFFQNGRKLGIGSSAASLVATAKLVESLSGYRFEFEELLDLHRRFHGRGGSGLDVAAAQHGGVIEYRDKMTKPISLPANLQLRFVYTGYETSTDDMLARFRNWCTKSDKVLLDEWLKSSALVADSLGNATKFIESVAVQSNLLQQIDRQAKLGIFGTVHQTAARIASQSDLLYKPSGAGGGDMGLVMGTDSNALDYFSQKIMESGLIEQSMTISRSGVEVVE